MAEPLTPAPEDVPPPVESPADSKEPRTGGGLGEIVLVEGTEMDSEKANSGQDGQGAPTE